MGLWRRVWQRLETGRPQQARWKRGCCSTYLTKVPDREAADDGSEEDEDEDPRNVGDVGPEAEQDTDGSDLGGDLGGRRQVSTGVSVWFWCCLFDTYREEVAVHNVPAESKAKGGVAEELGVAHKRTGDGDKGGHLTKSVLDAADNETNEEVTKERAEGATSRDGTAKREEETSTDSTWRGLSVLCVSCCMLLLLTGKGNHGDVTLGEAATEVALVGSEGLSLHAIVRNSVLVVHVVGLVLGVLVRVRPITWVANVGGRHGE